MKFLFTLVIAVLLFVLHAEGQTPHHQHYSQSNTPHECGSDELMEELYRLHPELRVRQEVVDSQNQEAVYVRGLPESTGTVYSIPVVVHVVHRTGIPVGTDENISDAQIQQGITDLNDAFRNRGYYNSNTGADVEIEFCLATRNPQGRATNGITRTTNDQYADLNMDTEDIGMKTTISAWNTQNYCNIWLVREICANSSAGCSVAGYAYLSSAHGRFYDGVVNEAGWFGSSPANSSIHVHELGHYLNLYHTFHNGCTNNDCRTEGDRICDTPPDNSTSYSSCSSTPNSCTTDDNDLSINNPFRPTAQGGLGDQNDMIQNYMDYGNRNCKDRFTPGQKAWMLGTLTITRASLLQSDGCDEPCRVWADFATNDSTIILLGDSVSLVNTSINADQYEWSINGVLAHTDSNFVWMPTSTGSYVVQLTVSDTMCTDSVYLPFLVLPADAVFVDTAICSNQSYILPAGGIATATGRYIDTLLNQQGGDSIVVTYLTVHSLLAQAGFTTHDSLLFVLGSSVNLVNTSTNGQQYEWLVNGGVEHTGFNFTWIPNQSGIYEIGLRSSDSLCVDTSSTLSFTVLPSTTTTIDTTICEYTSYVLPDGASTTTVGRYVDTLTNTQGIDSIILTYVSRYPRYIVYDSVFVLVGDSYILPDGRAATQPSTYYSGLQSVYGCDSIIVTTLDTLPACGRDLVFEWAVGGGGSGHDVAYSICIDSQGNTYATGAMNGIVSFDHASGVYSISASGTHSSIYVAKYDPDGALIWAHGIPSASTINNAGHNIGMDGFGNVYVSGFFSSALDFDFGPNSHILTDNGRGSGFVQKIDPNGQLIWAKSIGGLSGLATINGMDVDDRGNVFLLGYFVDSVDLDPGPNRMIRVGNTNVFVEKLDPNGNLDWVVVNDPQFAGARDIALDAQNNVYISGSFRDTVDIDPGPGLHLLVARGSTEAIVQKLDSSGNFVWARETQGTSNPAARAEGRAIEVSPNGDIYVSGIFTGDVNFDPLSSNRQITSYSSIRDLFVLKLDTNGNLIWVTRQGGSRARLDAFDLLFDQQRGILVAGQYTGSVDFNSDPNRYEVLSDYNMPFVLKIGERGDFVYVKSSGSQGYAYANPFGTAFCLAQQPGSTDVYWGGNIQGSSWANRYGKFDLDPGADSFYLPPHGRSDFAIVKLNYSTAIFSDTTVTACGSYDWNGNTYYSSGTYRDTFQTAMGCDSIAMLLLYIPSVELSYTMGCRGSCHARLNAEVNFYLNGGRGNYQWSVPYQNHTRPSTSNNVCAGMQWVRIQDPATGCWAHDTVIVPVSSDTTAISFSTTYNCDRRTVSLAVQATGSAPPYNYSIRNGVFDTVNVFHNLYPNSYIIEVSDSNGCVASGRITIPSFPVSVNHVDSIVSCGPINWRGEYYESSGIYQDTTLRCDTVFTLVYSLIPIRTTATFISCSGIYWRGKYLHQPGTYHDTIMTTTVGECDTIHTINLSDILPVNISYNSSYGSFQVSCHDACDGSASVQNPDSNYTYRWSNGTIGIVNDSLCAGTYTVTVTNATGCTSTTSITLQGPPPVGVTSATMPVSCIGLSDGQLSLQGTGGVNFYDYSIDGGTTFVWPQQFYNLSAGVYHVQARDFNTCIAMDTIVIGVEPPITATTTDTACAPYPWQGQTLTTSGIYTDTTTDANGCDSILTLDLTIVICTDVATLSRDALNFEVYPVPNKGQFFLRGQAAKAVEELTLYNVLGQPVPIRYTQQRSDQIQITVATAVPEGVYVLRIRVGEQYYTKLVEVMP